MTRSLHFRTDIKQYSLQQLESFQASHEDSPFDARLCSKQLRAFIKYPYYKICKPSAKDNIKAIVNEFINLPENRNPRDMAVLTPDMLTRFLVYLCCNVANGNEYELNTDVETHLDVCIRRCSLCSGIAFAETDRDDYRRMFELQEALKVLFRSAIITWITISYSEALDIVWTSNKRRQRATDKIQSLLWYDDANEYNTSDDDEAANMAPTEHIGHALLKRMCDTLEFTIDPDNIDIDNENDVNQDIIEADLMDTADARFMRQDSKQWRAAWESLVNGFSDTEKYCKIEVQRTTNQVKIVQDSQPELQERVSKIKQMISKIKKKEAVILQKQTRLDEINVAIQIAMGTARKKNHGADNEAIKTIVYESMPGLFDEDDTLAAEIETEEKERAEMIAENEKRTAKLTQKIQDNIDIADADPEIFDSEFCIKTPLRHFCDRLRGDTHRALSLAFEYNKDDNYQHIWGLKRNSKVFYSKMAVQIRRQLLRAMHPGLRETIQAYTFDRYPSTMNDQIDAAIATTGVNLVESWIERSSIAYELLLHRATPLNVELLEITSEDAFDRYELSQDAMDSRTRRYTERIKQMGSAIQNIAAKIKGNVDLLQHEQSALGICLGFFKNDLIPFAAVALWCVGPFSTGNIRNTIMDNLDGYGEDRNENLMHHLDTIPIPSTKDFKNSSMNTEHLIYFKPSWFISDTYYIENKAVLIENFILTLMLLESWIKQCCEIIKDEQEREKQKDLLKTSINCDDKTSKQLINLVVQYQENCIDSIHDDEIVYDPVSSSSLTINSVFLRAIADVIVQYSPSDQYSVLNNETLEGMRQQQHAAGQFDEEEDSEDDVNGVTDKWRKTLLDEDLTEMEKYARALDQTDDNLGNEPVIKMHELGEKKDGDDDKKGDDQTSSSDSGSDMDEEEEEEKDELGAEQKLDGYEQEDMLNYSDNDEEDT